MAFSCHNFKKLNGCPLVSLAAEALIRPFVTLGHNVRLEAVLTAFLRGLPGIDILRGSVTDIAFSFHALHAPDAEVHTGIPHRNLDAVVPVAVRFGFRQGQILAVPPCIHRDPAPGNLF
jgi:hypothetical protein